jgi:hypothetical protein
VTNDPSIEIDELSFALDGDAVWIRIGGGGASGRVTLEELRWVLTSLKAAAGISKGAT